MGQPRVNLDARLPAFLAAKAVGVSRQLFNYWRSSGKIKPDERGLYRYGDAVLLEAKMRRNPHSTRRPAAGPRSWDELDRNTTALTRTSAR